MGSFLCIYVAACWLPPPPAPARCDLYRCPLHTPIVTRGSHRYSAAKKKATCRRRQVETLVLSVAADGLLSSAAMRGCCCFHRRRRRRRRNCPHEHEFPHLYRPAGACRAWPCCAAFSCLVLSCRFPYRHGRGMGLGQLLIGGCYARDRADPRDKAGCHRSRRDSKVKELRVHAVAGTSYVLLEYVAR